MQLSQDKLIERRVARDIQLNNLIWCAHWEKLNGYVRSVDVIEFTPWFYRGCHGIRHSGIYALTAKQSFSKAVTEEKVHRATQTRH